MAFHIDCAQCSAQTQEGRHTAGHKNLSNTFKRKALFLSDSAESNSNPMSSFAVLCSGITLCPQASELGQGTKIISVASNFTCCLRIVFRVNTGDQSTGEIRIYGHNSINGGLGLPYSEMSFYLSALSDWSCCRMMMNESGNREHTGANLNHSRADTHCPHTKPYFITQGA